jgi:hypothetical protein
MSAAASVKELAAVALLVVLLGPGRLMTARAADGHHGQKEYRQRAHAKPYLGLAVLFDHKSSSRNISNEFGSKR